MQVKAIPLQKSFTFSQARDHQGIVIDVQTHWLIGVVWSVNSNHPPTRSIQFPNNHIQVFSGCAKVCTGTHVTFTRNETAFDPPRPTDYYISQISSEQVDKAQTTYCQIQLCIDMSKGQHLQPLVLTRHKRCKTQFSIYIATFEELGVAVNVTGP